MVPFSYLLFVFTFIIAPLIAATLNKSVNSSRIFSISRVSIPFFLVHNILYYSGYSLKGDYIDYCIFSSEYFSLCLLLLSSCAINSVQVKIFRVIGYAALCLGYLTGGIGTLFFLVVCQDYESDEQFSFLSNGITYEVRRYSFGFATLDDTRYSFETYRTFFWIPIEKKIDRIFFLEMETKLDVTGDLHFTINHNAAKEYIAVQDKNGVMYTKQLR